jgi:hypothetical protein
MSAPGRAGPAGRQQGAVVSAEPQGVAELMERTEAAWQRQLEACADATADARAALVRSLAGLRAEYGDADYPRKAAIERELRALMRRHDALDQGVEPPAPSDDPFEPPPDDLDVPDAASITSQGVVPLGPESSVGSHGEERAAPAHAAHGPVPLGPESAVRSAGESRPAPPPPPPRPPSGAPRPIPHGAPGPVVGFADRPGDDPTGAGASEDDGGSAWGAPTPGGWTRAWGAVGRWAARGRLAVRAEVLLRKREARLAEVGVRIRQLEARGALATAPDDAGVRARLAQVAQVDTEIARVRARREALEGR